MTEEEFTALITIKDMAVDVCWDCNTKLWSGIVVNSDNTFFTESSDSRERLLHELARRTLGEAYDGKGIISADY